MTKKVKDKRKFPEEMKKKKSTSINKSISPIWLWLLFAIAILAAVLYFGYYMVSKPATVEQSETPTSKIEQEYRQNIETINALEAASTKTREERDAQLEAFFNSN